MAESSDGFIWRAIPLIPNGGTTIAAGDIDGYYIDASGHVVIVTSHLTYFGFKQPQTSVVIASISATKLAVNATTHMRAGGGNGTAAYKFVSKTPQICSVSALGLVKARSGGICRLLAVKGGDVVYLHKDSAVLTVRVLGPSIVASGSGSIKTIKVNLGSHYANWNVLLLYKEPGSKIFQMANRVNLDSQGRIVTEGSVPDGSVICVKAAGKIIATYGIPGK